MPRDDAADHREVEPTNSSEEAQPRPPVLGEEPRPITGATVGEPPRGGPHARLKPMRPERRLGPGNSVLTFPAPRAPGDAAHDGARGHDSASEQPDPGSHRGYDFWHHSDAGLLREPPGSFNFERWFPPWPERGRPGYWATIQVNPFGDSMSIIDEDAAKQFIGDGDLFAPARPSG
jgi:hypothetical protein